MNICVFHPRFAKTIAVRVAAAFPAAEVSAVDDTSIDPPQRDQIEVLVAFRFPDGMLGRMPRLRWLQLTGVGTDHVARGMPGSNVVITHAGRVPSVAVAEFVWMGVLGLAKDAPRLLQQQRERGWQLPRALKLAGSTMVILGLGRIGAEVARRARAFGVRVIAVTRTGAPSELADVVVTRERLAEVLPAADYVVNALPAHPSTYRMLDRDMLARLPPRASVISVGRASTIDVDAIAAAVRAGTLRSALLDVHEVEPLPPDSPLWSTEGVWVTPHCAYEYIEQAADLATLFVDNVTRFVASEPLLNVVDLIT